MKLHPLMCSHTPCIVPLSKLAKYLNDDDLIKFRVIAENEYGLSLPSAFNLEEIVMQSKPPPVKNLIAVRPVPDSVVL